MASKKKGAQIVTTVESFLSALNHSVIGKKNTIPILTYVRITNQRVLGTDLDKFTIIPFEGSGEADFMLPYKTAIEVLKGERGKLTITPGENFWVKLDVNGISYDLTGMNIAGYPAFPTPADTTATIEGKEMLTLINRSRFAVSEEESRYTLNGVLLSVGKRATLASSDGHRLCLATGKGTGELPKTIVRFDAMDWLKKNAGETVEIGIDNINEHQTFVTDGRTLVVRKLKGEFPNIDAVMPKKGEYSCAVTIDDPKKFEDRLKRVAKCSDERSGCVRFLFDQSGITLSAESTERGSAKTQLGYETEGLLHPVAVGLNSEYVLELLKVVGKEPVKVSLEAPDKALLFEIPNLKYIQMPMRI